MTAKENEYKELFMAEALDSYEELSRLLTRLEKEPSNKKIIDSIFRITHTLKGNASGMGFDGIASLSHVIEDMFGCIRDGKLAMDADIFKNIFKALDKLSELILSIKEDKKVQFKGIVAKLRVLMNDLDANSLVRSTGSTVDMPHFGEEPTGDITDADKQGEHEPVEYEKNKITFSDFVQVPVHKLDELLNLVGELVIEKDRIVTTQEKHQSASEFNRLKRISSDLQYSVMDVRLVQVGFLFNKFHRVVRDAAAIERKEVELVLEGVETELDRNILQTISDAMIHLIRNAIGHGIEQPEERKNFGKPTVGRLRLSARNERDGVLIDISDDGMGIALDKVRKKAFSAGLLSEEMAAAMTARDLMLLIFEPGFSTVDKVSTLSGRGVGMDVVKKSIESVGGTIDVRSEKGKGTTISLRLPSSMAVKGALLFELGNDQYAIPLTHTEAVVSMQKSNLYRAGGRLVATYADETISVVFLRDLFTNNDKLAHANYPTNYQMQDEGKLDLVVVKSQERTVGLVVDKLLQQKEIVEKPLMKPVDKVPFISGVTILGNGNVCLVINVPSIFSYVFKVGVSSLSGSALVS